MNVSEIAIKKPVFAWMLMVAMILFGYLSFREMGVSQLPDVDLPVINVNVTWEGAAIPSTVLGRSSMGVIGLAVSLPGGGLWGVGSSGADHQSVPHPRFLSR